MTSRALESPTSPGVVSDPVAKPATTSPKAARSAVSSAVSSSMRIVSSSGPFQSGVGGDQPLDALADERDGHFLVALDDPAADHDPVTEAPMLHAVAGLPRRLLLGAQRISSSGRR